MRRMIFLISCLILTCYPISAQDNEDIKFIAKLLTVDPEELEEDEVERLSALLKRPVLLNIASQDELNSCGIFTRFQVASLMDYRKRSGPCLSFMELSALNGFGEDFVTKIKPFVSLESLPDLSGRNSQEFTERISWRYTPGLGRYGYASRYKIKVGEFITASVACNRSLDAGKVAPDAVCASAEVRFKKMPASLVIGDFNARFGQGLAMWTGSNFTSLNTPSSFMKRNFGATPTSSFTGNNVMTGLAGEYNFDRWSLTILAAMPGIKSIKAKPEKVRFLPACNLTYGWKNGQTGLTHYLEFAGLASALYIPNMKTSFDYSMCVQGVDTFSEIMYDWVKQQISLIAGVVSPVGDGGSVAAMFRALDSEYALSASGSLIKKSFTGSVASDVTLYTVRKDKTQNRRLQFKFHTQWQYNMTDCWQLNVRLTERIRSWGQMLRTDLRTDLTWKSEMYSLSYRFNVLQSKDQAWLTYLEGGVKREKLSAYFRQGFFVVDNWDDRIYVYERDVPGAYNSPAFYGRGMWTSFIISLKTSQRCKLYFRTGITTYPFMEEEKPGKAELRFQSVFDF